MCFRLNLNKYISGPVLIALLAFLIAYPWLNSLTNNLGSETIMNFVYLVVGFIFLLYILQWFYDRKKKK